MEQKRAIVAGAGSAGLLMARELARAGFGVKVFEALDEATYMSLHNWSDAIEFSAFEMAGMPVPVLEGKRFTGPGVRPAPGERGLFEPHAIPDLAIFSPDYSVRTKSDVKFRYVVADRQELRRIQLEQALSEGVEIAYKTRIDGLLGEIGRPLSELKIEGVKADGADHPADLVIDASGREGNLRRMVGNDALVEKVCGKAKAEAFRTVRRYKDGPAPFNFIDHYRYGAYQGYFWIHFHDEGIVDIGGGMPFGGGIKEKVLELVSTFPNVTDEELRGGGGVLYLNEPPPTLVAGGFMVIGDSAGQVNPNNGCGVGSAWIGALAAIDAIKRAKDFTLESLWLYNKEWFHGRGAHYAALNTMKNLLQELSHDEIALLMRMNVMSGELLTNNLNGVFAPSSASDSFRALGLIFRSPSLLSKLMKANSAGKKCYDRYMSYPGTWNEQSFNAWRDTGS